VTHPSQWKQVHLADVGTSEPFLARLTLGLVEILNATSFARREEITSGLMNMTTECLIPAFLSLRVLRRIAGSPDEPLLTKTKQFDDMCKSLWSAYKDRMQSVTRLMGYDIGFLFQKDSVFEEGCKEFVKVHPEVSEELIARMKGNRATWQPELARFRNDYLEHQKIQREDVAAFYSLPRAEETFRNVWITVEEILVLLMAAGLHPMTCLREIPENERNPSNPLRFGFAWRTPPTLSESPSNP
jgi:hypothetical protein